MEAITLTKAQEQLRNEIEKINDAVMIDKVRIFVASIMAQQTGDLCNLESTGVQLQPDQKQNQEPKEN